MFIVFEGIDGSGKTTLSGRVSELLAERGVDVEQARPKGELKSRLASRIRTLARDPSSLTMSPHTELLLYLARDSQMIDTVIRPALERADVLIADRYVHSAMVLCRARGRVAADEVDRVAGVVARDLWPDLVVYCDVDISTSNLRKRIAKSMKLRDPHDFGRKGLGGLGLRDRMRDEYLKLAAEDPDRWFVVDNARGSVEANAARIANRALEKLGRAEMQIPVPEEGHVAMGPVPSADDPRDAFYGYLERLADDGQGRLAAYHVRSIDSPRAWELRDRLVQEAPEGLALGLSALGSERAVAMRRTLASVVPRQVARSLGDRWADEHPDALELRRQLVEKAPADVAGTLGTLDTDAAWELREALAEAAPGVVLASLKTLETDRAWDLRDRLGQKKKNDWGLLEGLAGIDDDRAWEIRHRRLKRALPYVILSTGGLRSGNAWEVRLAYADAAPKLVLKSLAGVDSRGAWTLRFKYGEWCKEALTTIKNDGSDDAWKLREYLREVWPAFAAKSVGMTLAGTEPGLAFLRGMMDARPADPEVAHYLVKALEIREAGSATSQEG